MKTVRAALVALAAVVSAGCSAGAQYVPPGPDQLASSTSDLVVAEAALPQTDSARCENFGPLVVIRTGNESAGTTTVLSTAENLRVESVQMRETGGFTGSYWRDTGGSADAAVTGTTYTINGTAQGFATDNRGFTASRTFKVTAAC